MDDIIKSFVATGSIAPGAPVDTSSGIDHEWREKCIACTKGWNRPFIESIFSTLCKKWTLDPEIEAKCKNIVVEVVWTSLKPRLGPWISLCTFDSLYFPDTLAQQKDTVLELESRLGMFVDDVIGNITEEMYLRLLRWINTQEGTMTVQTLDQTCEIKDYEPMRFRWRRESSSFSTSSTLNINDWTWAIGPDRKKNPHFQGVVRKRRLGTNEDHSIKNCDSGVRLACALEIPLPDALIGTVTQMMKEDRLKKKKQVRFTITRYKTARVWSLQMSNGCTLTIEVSKVRNKVNGVQGAVDCSFEVECEYGPTGKQGFHFSPSSVLEMIQQGFIPWCLTSVLLHTLALEKVTLPKKGRGKK